MDNFGKYIVNLMGLILGISLAVTSIIAVIVLLIFYIYI
tara:strand:+ start:204 stop:320 length:117 start_codon:yes stop_codon:yes gene_type:complete